MMTDKPAGLADYYRAGESWAKDRDRMRATSVRTAWTVATITAGIAVFEAIALVALTPLKTVEPYTLLVDRQTGAVQQLKPIERQMVAPDTALTRSMLAQYVIARESFDIDGFRGDYRKVALWTEGQERSRYIASMAATNPGSPLAALPRRAIVQTQIKSISTLDPDTSLIRFSTVRADPGGQAGTPVSWVAIIKYHFTTASMSEADRLNNPLGLQVYHYRRSAETAPEDSAPARANDINQSAPETSTETVLR